MSRMSLHSHGPRVQNEVLWVTSKTQLYAGFISVDQGNCCTIGRVFEGRMDELNHIQNISTTST
jgi:hypothetical protein